MTPQQSSGLAFATDQYNRSQDVPLTPEQYLQLRTDIILDEMVEQERAAKVAALTELGARIVAAPAQVQAEIIAFASSKLTSP
jgi:hypothetical protein